MSLSSSEGLNKRGNHSASLALSFRVITPSQTIPLRHRVLWPNAPLSQVLLPSDDQGIHLGAFLIPTQSHAPPQSIVTSDLEASRPQGTSTASIATGLSAVIEPPSTSHEAPSLAKEGIESPIAIISLFLEAWPDPPTPSTPERDPPISPVQSIDKLTSSRSRLQPINVTREDDQDTSHAPRGSISRPRMEYTGSTRSDAKSVSPFGEVGEGARARIEELRGVSPMPGPIIHSGHTQAPAESEISLNTEEQRDEDREVQVPVRFRKFACDQLAQGKGVGSRLLEEAARVAREEMGGTVLWCDARVSTREWYVKRGLKVFGTTFWKDGVEYVRMRRDIRG